MKVATEVDELYQAWLKAEEEEEARKRDASLIMKVVMEVE
jgi:hypothetical protein